MLNTYLSNIALIKIVKSIRNTETEKFLMKENRITIFCLINDILLKEIV